MGLAGAASTARRVALITSAQSALDAHLVRAAKLADSSRRTVVCQSPHDSSRRTVVCQSPHDRFGGSEAPSGVKLDLVWDKRLPMRRYQDCLAPDLDSERYASVLDWACVEHTAQTIETKQKFLPFVTDGFAPLPIELLMWLRTARVRSPVRDGGHPLLAALRSQHWLAALARSTGSQHWLAARSRRSQQRSTRSRSSLARSTARSTRSQHSMLPPPPRPRRTR